MIAAADAAGTCDVFLSIGTSSLVYPAAGLAESALQAGATVIEINPNRTDLSGAADFALQGPSGVLLPRLLAALPQPFRPMTVPR
jgi:NAD-dependent deacetylase